jgi:transposase
MEATGAYSQPLADFLVAKGYSVSVVNPAKIKAYAKSELSRAKTDKAKLIARSMQLGLWTLPPSAIRRLHALTRRIERLLEIQQMERNRLDTADNSITAASNSLLKAVEDEI